MRYFSRWNGIPRLSAFRFDHDRATLLAAALGADENPSQVFEQNVPGFIAELRKLLRASEHGMVVVDFDAIEELPRLASSLSLALGPALPETLRTDGNPMQPREHVEITLQHATRDVGRLRHFADPTLPWPLHTDRTLHVDSGDFLLVAKQVEQESSGGRIRLLHIDDFRELPRFLDSPFASLDLEWKGDALLAPPTEIQRLRRTPGVFAPVFTPGRNGCEIRFTDSRFRRPLSLEHMSYLESLGDAIEAQAAEMEEFDLPVGALYVVNNRRVLHGRSGFENKPGFRRTIVRFCGNLS